MRKNFLRTISTLLGSIILFMTITASINAKVYFDGNIDERAVTTEKELAHDSIQALSAPRTYVEEMLATHRANNLGGTSAVDGCMTFAVEVVSYVFGIKDSAEMNKLYVNYHANWKNDGSYGALNLAGRISTCSNYPYGVSPPTAYHNDVIDVASTKALFKTARPGDIFQGCGRCENYLGGGQHTAIIQEVRDDGVVFYEAGFVIDQYNAYKVLHYLSYNKLMEKYPHVMGIYTVKDYSKIDYSLYSEQDTPIKEDVQKPVKTELAFSNQSISYNGSDNAVVKIVCNRPTGVRVEECGLYFGTSSLQKVSSEVPGSEAQNNPNYFEIYYDLKSECGISLKKGQSYSYQFFIRVGGIEHKSSVYKWICPADLTESKSCSHSFNYMGVCTKCKESFPIQLQREGATMYATRDNLPVHNAPYGKAKITERIEKTETEVRVVGYAINAFGNKWYKTSSGGWIVYDYLTSDIPKKEESKDAKRNDISFSDLKSSFNGKDSAMIQISCNRPTGLYVEE